MPIRWNVRRPYRRQSPQKKEDTRRAAIIKNLKTVAQHCKVLLTTEHLMAKAPAPCLLCDVVIAPSAYCLAVGVHPFYRDKYICTEGICHTDHNAIRKAYLDHYHHYEE